MDLGHIDIRLEQELRRSLDGGTELFMAYQPKLDLLCGKVVGLEALIRWQHPTRGLVLPDAFIPLAEDSLLITPLGDWVLASVIRQIKAWRGSELEDVPLSINLSPLQLRDADFPARAASLCHSQGIEPTLLEFEITENAFIGDFAHATHTLNAIKADGFRLSLDDFGTGYSSLSYLANLPLDALKLAGSFIGSIEENSKTASILRAVIALSRELGLELIVEGVETLEQHRWLRNAGCDIGQGYYYSHPLPPERLLDEIRNGFPSRPQSTHPPRRAEGFPSI